MPSTRGRGGFSREPSPEVGLDSPHIVRAHEVQARYDDSPVCGSTKRQESRKSVKRWCVSNVDFVYIHFIIYLLYNLVAAKILQL
eukprot:SAG31_NODE_213_length_20124_cov_17.709613_2_plen_85_part_00